ncbi:CoA pyrophosphatase [Roseovarius sp. EGI FJ00037]|uniref:CoA pyrophosphatase n=1 Tax=Roseovarius salincola TaxID=2978479 RepID=UPI0022A67835|nr:CoA pyrophosphatase [Roseovarius sp. EGI FJ00037]MCZ0811307.1 CoA pyrophosphatase [Roseovarius sp. EGI FJ00037]
MHDPLRLVHDALERARKASSDYDLNPETVLPPGRKLRPAGVLVPILCDGASARIYLTKRSSALKHHPGQIAFPGGKQDEADADIVTAALREAHEEIGLAPANVEVLGQMPSHETVTGFMVTPVVARVKAPFEPRPEPGEVEEIFEVPLMHLLDCAQFSIQARRWRGNWRKYYTVPFGPYYIWGATARILRVMADAAEAQ